MDEKTDLKNGVLPQYIKAQSEQEIKDLSEFADKVYHEYFVSTGIVSKEQVDYMVDMMLSPKAIAKSIDEGYEFYLFGDQKDPIAFCAIRNSKNDMFLSKLYVRSDIRGAGLGRAILGFLREICEKNNLSSIWLTCNKENAGSLAFYDKMGFIIEDSKTVDIGNGYVMDDHYLRVFINADTKF